MSLRNVIVWAFGFEAIDNDRGEIKTELQAPVVHVKYLTM